jgi:hypothetical protein
MIILNLMFEYISMFDKLTIKFVFVEICLTILNKELKNHLLDQ